MYRRESLCELCGEFFFRTLRLRSASEKLFVLFPASLFLVHLTAKE